MTLRRAFHFGTCLLAGWMTASCGNNGMSSQVSIIVTPNQPPVITGNFIHNNTTIQAPWFQFNATVNNNSTSPVTIIGLQLNVSGTRSDGTTVMKTINILPSDYNYTMTCNNATTAQIQFTDFGQFAPGQSGSLQLIYQFKNTLPLDCTGNGQTPDIPIATLYAGGNPNQTTDHVTSFTFSVQMQPMGWFGTRTAATQRLENFVFFSTQ